jgi:hypothetical protein
MPFSLSFSVRFSLRYFCSREENALLFAFSSLGPEMEEMKRNKPVFKDT